MHRTSLRQSATQYGRFLCKLLSPLAKSTENTTTADNHLSSIDSRSNKRPGSSIQSYKAFKWIVSVTSHINNKIKHSVVRFFLSLHGKHWQSVYTQAYSKFLLMTNWDFISFLIFTFPITFSLKHLNQFLIKITKKINHTHSLTQNHQRHIQFTLFPLSLSQILLAKFPSKWKQSITRKGTEHTKPLIKGPWENKLTQNVPSDSFTKMIHRF